MTTFCPIVGTSVAEFVYLTRRKHLPANNNKVQSQTASSAGSDALYICVAPDSGDCSEILTC